MKSVLYASLIVSIGALFGCQKNVLESRALADEAENSNSTEITQDKLSELFNKLNSDADTNTISRRHGVECSFSSSAVDDRYKLTLDYRGNEVFQIILPESVELHRSIDKSYRASMEFVGKTADQQRNYTLTMLSVPHLQGEMISIDLYLDTQNPVNDYFSTFIGLSPSPMKNQYGCVFDRSQN